jgi:hypothetical protein
VDVGSVVPVPGVEVDLQAGSVGLDWQTGLLAWKSVVSPLSKSSSKYGKSKVSDEASLIVPMIDFDLQNGASGDVVQMGFFSDPESAGREPDVTPVVPVPGVEVDLQAGSVGLDWQTGLFTEGGVVSPFPTSVSKYGKSNDAGGTSVVVLGFVVLSGVVVVPVVVCDLQNWALGDTLQISFLVDPIFVEGEPDGVPVFVSVVVDDLQAGSVGLDWQDGLT